MPMVLDCKEQFRPVPYMITNVVHEYAGVVRALRNK